MRSAESMLPIVHGGQSVRMRGRLWGPWNLIDRPAQVRAAIARKVFAPAPDLSVLDTPSALPEQMPREVGELIRVIAAAPHNAVDSQPLPNEILGGVATKGSARMPGMKGAKRGSGRVRRGKRGKLDGPAAFVHLVPDLEPAVREALDLCGRVVRDDLAPQGNGLGGDVERPGDIRGALIVLDGGLLKHGDANESTLKTNVQVAFTDSAVGFAAMDHLATLADRLRDAMGEEINASDLARACHISPAAVSAWLNGGTKRLNADNYAAASRALGVREEWLRTGRLPRERDAAPEEREIDHIMELLAQMQGPLAALSQAIDRLVQARATPRRRHRNGS